MNPLRHGSWREISVHMNIFIAEPCFGQLIGQVSQSVAGRFGRGPKCRHGQTVLKQKQPLLGCVQRENRKRSNWGKKGDDHRRAKTFLTGTPVLSILRSGLGWLHRERGDLQSGEKTRVRGCPQKPLRTGKESQRYHSTREEQTISNPATRPCWQRP